MHPLCCALGLLQGCVLEIRNIHVEGCCLASLIVVVLQLVNKRVNRQCNYLFQSDISSRCWALESKTKQNKTDFEQKDNRKILTQACNVQKTP